MAKRRTSGEPSTKQGVLISLGICIPLLIGLGVATYFGFAGKGEAETRAKAAGDDKAKADKARGEAEAKAALLKAYAGIPLDKNDESLFVDFHDKGLSGGDGEVGKMIKDLDTDPGWDGVQRKPKDTLRNQVTALRSELTATKNALDKLNKTSSDTIAKLG